MLEAIKLKLAAGRLRPQPRIPKFESSADLADPEASHHLPPAEQWLWATPSLERNENIQLMLSNHGQGRTLLVQLKWRPDFSSPATSSISSSSSSPPRPSSNKNVDPTPTPTLTTAATGPHKLATLHTRLVFCDKQDTYSYENTETYAPAENPRRPGCIAQYGSSWADFKMVPENASRRLRIVFRGHMRKSESGESGESLFVRFSMIACPTTRFYDLKTEIDPDFFIEQWKARAASESSKLELDYAIEHLAFEDRLEQTHRFVGDLRLGPWKHPRTQFLWGFCSRTFNPGGVGADSSSPPQPDESSASEKDDEPQVTRKRLFCMLTNGQIFQIIQATSELDGGAFKLENGYACLGIRSSQYPLSRRVQKLDWSSLESAGQFELIIENLDLRMELKGRERRDLGGNVALFQVEFNETPGLAYFTKDNAIMDERELEFEEWLRDHLGAFKRSLVEGAIARTLVASSAQNALVLNVSSDDECLDSDLVGCKASGLAQLARFSTHLPDDKFKVPQAIVVTKFGYELILSENPELRDAAQNLDEFLASEEGKVHAKVKSHCEQLVDKFGRVEMPQALRDQLKGKLDSLGFAELEKEPFAVRSSSWGEDTEEMSAAGQLRTSLNIRGTEAIQEAILECFASKFSAENVQYKRQHGLSANFPMAVVIQSMVQCHKAGVMFTCDPLSGDKSVVTITANFGLGESVVNGEADPDHIRVRVLDAAKAEVRLLEAKAGKKSVVISEQEEVHKWARDKCCMGEDEMLRIAQCGLLVSTFFHQAPRDIEWGLRDNRMFLFQARPVTGLDLYSTTELLHEADRVSRAEDEWRTRVNLNEVFPYAMSPFSITYYVQSWSVLRAAFWQQLNPVTDLSPDGDAEISCEMYHNFISLRRSFLFGITNPDGSKSPLMESTQMGFFGHDVGPQPGIARASKNIPSPPQGFDSAYFQMITLPMRWAPIFTMKRQYSLVRSTERLVKDDSRHLNGSTPARDLCKLLALVLRNHAKSLMNHFYVIMFGGFANKELQSMLARHVKDPRELCAALNRFLGVAENVVSAEIPKRVGRLADLIRAKGPLSGDKFALMSISEAVNFMRDQKKNPDLAKEFGEFMAGFGHRCYNEWEHRESPWRENLTQVVLMLQQNCSIDQVDVDKVQRNKVETNDQILDSLGVKFTAKERLAIRNKLAPKCQALVAARELSKDVSIRYIDLERQVTRKLARVFHRQLRLPDPDLFYYLMYDELAPLIEGPQPAIVSQALRRRQLFKREFDHMWIFDEIIEGYNIKPRHKQATEELSDAILNAPRLLGNPASSGKVTGPVRIIRRYEQLVNIKPGDILVTYSTDIAYSPIFPLVGGIVTEVGGLISHGAVVAREYGLPSLLGVLNATKVLEDGEQVLLDANRGWLIRLSKKQEQHSQSV